MDNLASTANTVKKESIANKANTVNPNITDNTANAVNTATDKVSAVINGDFIHIK